MRQYQIKANSQGTGDEATNFMNAQEFNSLAKALNKIAGQVGVPFSSIAPASFEDTDNTVLSRAIQSLVSYMSAYEDVTLSSEPNSKILASTYPSISLQTILQKGFRLSFINNHVTTGAVTIKVGDFDIKPFVSKEGSQLNAGDMAPNTLIDAFYDGSVFRALNISTTRQIGLMYFGVQQGNSLLCNGAAYLNTQYPELHARIGTTYGSDGATKFRVPDFQNRVPRGVGSLINHGEKQGDAIKTFEFSFNTNTAGGYAGLGLLSGAGTATPDLVKIYKTATRTQNGIAVQNGTYYSNFDGVAFRISDGNNETKVKATGVNFYIFY